MPLLMSFPRKSHFYEMKISADILDLRIWKQFIPFPYHQVFQRGAYYSTEVIPGSVAAISLNTMYFYDSNKGKSRAVYFDPSNSFGT